MLAPSGRGDEPEFVGEQVVTFGLTGAGQRESGVFLAEDEVELAGDQGGKGGLGVEFGDLDAQKGVLLLELDERVRDEGQDGGLEGRNAQRAGGLVQGCLLYTSDAADE